MKRVEITVLVTTYHSDYKKLERTLKSTVCQSGVSFEIVITDDGSEDNLFTEIQAFFEEVGFEEYTLVSSDKNTGTVGNFIRGLEASRGKYVKAISPGDLLYSEDTLKGIVSYMRAMNVSFCFGDAAYYQLTEENKPILVNSINRPNRLDCYKALNYNSSIVRERVLWDGDVVLGAEIAYEKSSILKYLKLMRGKVIYAEDYSIYFYAEEHQRIGYLDDYMIFYEFGSGISIKTNNKWAIALKKDLFNVFEIMKTIYPLDNEIPRAEKYQQLLFENNYLKRNVGRVLLRPQKLIAKQGRIYQSNERVVSEEMLQDIFGGKSGE